MCRSSTRDWKFRRSGCNADPALYSGITYLCIDKPDGQQKEGAHSRRNSRPPPQSSSLLCYPHLLFLRPNQCAKPAPIVWLSGDTSARFQIRAAHARLSPFAGRLRADSHGSSQVLILDATQRFARHANGTGTKLSDAGRNSYQAPLRNLQQTSHQRVRPTLLRPIHMRELYVPPTFARRILC